MFHIIHPFPHAVPSERQPALHGSLGDIQRFGNLRDALAVHVAADDDFAVHLRQERHFPPHAHSILRRSLPCQPILGTESRAACLKHLVNADRRLSVTLPQHIIVFAFHDSDHPSSQIVYLAAPFL